MSGTIPYDFNYMYQLSSLSLQTNDLTGSMQWGLCPGCYNMVDLKADCEEITCDCCTECFIDVQSKEPTNTTITMATNATQTATAVPNSTARTGGLRA